MNKKKMLPGLLVSVILLILLDQFTKYLAVVHLFQQEPIEIFPGVFELHFLKNKGAAFGIMQNQKYFFVVITSILVMLMIYLLVRIPETKKNIILSLTIGLLISGAIGNLIDRIRLGYVIDFFYFKLIDFPIFNVADCYVVVAVIILMLLILFYYKDEEITEITNSLLPWKK